MHAGPVPAPTPKALIKARTSFSSLDPGQTQAGTTSNDRFTDNCSQPNHLSSLAVAYDRFTDFAVTYAIEIAQQSTTS